MEFKAGRYVSHCWFVNSGNSDKDWMCWLYRDPGEDWSGEPAITLLALSKQPWASMKVKLLPS
jgi:hypothetical protein